ncbi:uncharacterized protein LOC104583993 [Brachypodium distachyon]|uniref:uncharacterized protein LOC104583993 n=1 Tax=Brachypodium distachyon TaxID=15368 RepID=UPI000D0CA57C|nr:uncharacterized protein LOC104583993 [Brachypodium distachyon]|eukprot:XP_024317118.1 uncharacterized protein LOC104583993 [Brachypodium distachyon]
MAARHGSGWFGDRRAIFLVVPHLLQASFWTGNLSALICIFVSQKKAFYLTNFDIRYQEVVEGDDGELEGEMGCQLPRAIGFLEAWRLPGVAPYVFCLFFSKLVAYTFLYWLPFYIRNNGEPAAMDNGGPSKFPTPLCRSLSPTRSLVLQQVGTVILCTGSTQRVVLQQIVQQIEEEQRRNRSRRSKQSNRASSSAEELLSIKSVRNSKQQLQIHFQQ